MLQPTESKEEEEEIGVATDGQQSKDTPEEEKEGESCDDVVGMKCRAPLKEVGLTIVGLR